MNMTETLIDSSLAGGESLWDDGDLVRRLCHVLDTAARVISTLAPNGYVDAEEPDNSVRPEKVISETAFLLRAASTVAFHNEISVRVERVANLLIPFARSERIALGMCLQPALSMDYAQAHICLNQLGYPDHTFDELLRQADSSEARHGKERVPHRVLEMDWLVRIWNGSVQPTSIPDAAYTSVLNRTMDLLHGTREDVYGFTHALMYLRDFNRNPLPLPRSREEILSEAQALLARCLEEQDYDLGGEVLLAWPLTSAQWSSGPIFAFRVLMKVEDKAGFLPTPMTRLERLQRLTGDARNRYLLATTYHTIYVMGLLCSLALQPGFTPPKTIPECPRTGISQLILSYLDSDNSTPHWREEAELLTEQERDSIAELLFSIALYRKVKQKQYGTARELLEHADRFGLLCCPSAIQTAELLERLARCAPLLQKG